MHVITRRRLIEFSEKHPDAYKPLDQWYRIVKLNNFDSFYDLQKSFPHVDQVSRLTVFNIGSNKFRLIAYIVYVKKRIYIRNILTHKEYDKGNWKE